MTLFGGVLLYLGLIGMAAGLISLVRPLRILRIRSRRQGAVLAGTAFLLFTAGVYLPIDEFRADPARSRLDEFAPVFQFHEVHSLTVAASREQVDAAIRSVEPDEIRWYRTLTWLRRVVQPQTHGVLNPPAGRPILDTFTSGPFPVLADEPGREIVLGQPRTGRPVQIALNFRIEEAGAGRCRVSTETRVHASGRHVVRGFATYWRMIYPGSALIRRMWLRAIQARAEASPVSNRT